MSDSTNPRGSLPALSLALCAVVLYFAARGALDWLVVLTVLLLVAAPVTGTINLVRRGSVLPNLAAILLGLGGTLFFGAVFVPEIGRRERCRRTACASNLKQIAYGVHLYSADHDEAFPESLPVLHEKDYLVDHKVFLCPRARDKVVPFTAGGTFTEDNVSYCYASGVHPTDPPRFIVAFDEESNHEGDGVNVLFIGGNVEWRNDFNWLHDQLEKQKRAMAAQGRTMRVLRPGWSEAPEDGLSWR